MSSARSRTTMENNDAAAGISRMGRALGIGPFSRAKKNKPKPKPLFTFAGFAVTRFETIMSGLFALYLLWGLTQIL